VAFLILLKAGHDDELEAGMPRIWPIMNKCLTQAYSFSANQSG